jgi:hypothetical protein
MVAFRYTASEEPRDDTTADQLPPAQLDQIERVDKQAITRTALLSSMKSSRHSGKSVYGP